MGQKISRELLKNRAFTFALIKAQLLPGILMGAFLRVEAAGMATTVDYKKYGRWLPENCIVYFSSYHVTTICPFKRRTTESQIRLMFMKPLLLGKNIIKSTTLPVNYE